MKRQRKSEGDDGEEGDEEERRAEEKLRHLQEMVEKFTAESSDGACPFSDPTGRLKSSWQQTGNLLLYTAAGVRGSHKVGPRTRCRHLLVPEDPPERLTIVTSVTLGVSLVAPLSLPRLRALT